MITDQEYDELVAEHLALSGGHSMHMSLGPDVTFEGVRANLKMIRDLTEEYNQFTEIEKARALIHRLEDALHQCWKASDRLDYRDPVQKEVMDICFKYGDFIVDTDFEKDISYMRKQQKT